MATERVTEMNNGQVRLHQGDSRDVLKTLADASIDSIVCDPPYALVSIQKRFGKAGSAPAKHGTDGAFARAARGFMGKDWDVADTAFAETFWAECLRVLKPGGHVVAFGGTRTYHRLVCAIEDAGFEIRDQLGWVYGSGFPKSHDVSKGIDKRAGAEREVVGTVRAGIARSARKGDEFVNTESFEELKQSPITVPATDLAAQWEGWGTALKPAWEPICLARKPLIGTVVANVLEHGTGAINIDGCRVELSAGDDPRLGGNGSWTTSQQQDGSTVTLPRGEVASSPLGRWPANIIHDGSDEVLSAFPSTAPSSDRPRHNAEFKSVAKGRDLPHTTFGHADAGGTAARFFYCAKASRKDRDEGLAQRESGTIGDGWTVAADIAYQRGKTERKNIHPTVKPTSLMQYLCRLITPPGGTILDPFMGSGSTGKAAVLEGFNFVGIEREDEYMPIAEARIAWAVLRAEGKVVDREPVGEVAAPTQPANDNPSQEDLFSGAA